MVDSCRTESRHFCKVPHGNPHFNVRGCSHTVAGNVEGDFFNVNGSTTGVVESCVSIAGRMVLQQDCRVKVANSSFGRTDWISIVEPAAGMQIELENIQFGDTTNRVGAGNPRRILRQRITKAGTFNYVVEAAH